MWVMRTKDAQRIRAGIERARFRIVCMLDMGISMPDEVTPDLTGKAFERTMTAFRPALKSFNIHVGRAERFSRGKLNQTFIELVDMRDGSPGFGRGPSLDDLRLELKRLAETV